MSTSKMKKGRMAKGPKGLRIIFSKLRRNLPSGFLISWKKKGKRMEI